MTLQETIETYSKLTHLRFTVLKEWHDEGHPVVWTLCEMTTIPCTPRYELSCLCEFAVEEVLPTGFEKGRGSSMGYRLNHTAGGCAIKDVVASHLRREAHEQFGKRWEALGIDRSIVNLFQRSYRGVPFGQRYSDELDEEEVGEILGLSDPEQRLGRLAKNGVIRRSGPYSPYWRL